VVIHALGPLLTKPVPLTPAKELAMPAGPHLSSGMIAGPSVTALSPIRRWVVALVAVTLLASLFVAASPRPAAADTSWRCKTTSWGQLCLKLTGTPPYSGIDIKFYASGIYPYAGTLVRFSAVVDYQWAPDTRLWDNGAFRINQGQTKSFWWPYGSPGATGICVGGSLRFNSSHAIVPSGGDSGGFIVPSCRGTG
jgi:hypothetical protein